jgi:hypothetical protein
MRMKNKLIKIIICTLFLFVSIYNCFAQEPNKDVIISASGSGKTLEEAKQSALRSATEQAFGSFISSKMEIFNDQVVADQMSSVSSGNIKSFEVLSEAQLPNNNWAVTIKAVVSVDNLTSFVQAKGITIEIKGGMFALKIKQQLLNEQGELKALAEMVGLLHEPMQISFDYVIKSSIPQSLDSKSKNWAIPLEVTAKCNKNFDICANYFKKTLSALSLTTSEVETYKALDKKVFPINFNYKGLRSTFFLRKERSISTINSLLSNWKFYLRLFEVKSEIDTTFGKGEGQLFNVYKDGISFPKSGDIVGTFTWNVNRTLSEIEQISGFSVRPRGIVSNFKNGGYVLWQKDGHGLIVALCDLGKFNWTTAISACDELEMNGFSDWYLPTKDDLQFLYLNHFFLDKTEYKDYYYWSSTKDEDDWYSQRGWYFDNYEGNAKRDHQGREFYVRPVRKF